MSGNLRDVGTRRRRDRDPSGKAALFSSTPVAGDDTAAPEPAAPAVRPAPPPEPPRAKVGPRRNGTVVVDCSSCGARARVGYLDFLLLNLPVGVWLPLPGLDFNRRMTCPTCGHWTWVQAHWFE